MFGWLVVFGGRLPVHFPGEDYQENRRTTKNTDFEKVMHLFDLAEINPESKLRKFWVYRQLIRIQSHE